MKNLTKRIITSFILFLLLYFSLINSFILFITIFLLNLITIGELNIILKKIFKKKYKNQFIFLFISTIYMVFFSTLSFMVL